MSVRRYVPILTEEQLRALQRAALQQMQDDTRSVSDSGERSIRLRQLGDSVAGAREESEQDEALQRYLALQDALGVLTRCFIRGPRRR